MGRPKEHDDKTAFALIEAAERIVQAGGLSALSVRAVATEVGTTTRAVYSLYGSKEGLLVALGSRAFDILGTAIDALPTTDNPQADLVEAGLVVFRRFAVRHPSLFRIGVQHSLPEGADDLATEFRGAAASALAGLRARIKRVEDAGLLGRHSVYEATYAFHALCEGLAAVELRGLMPAGLEEGLWRDALVSLVAGLSMVPSEGDEAQT